MVHTKATKRPASVEITPTIGDLIAAAYDTLGGDTRAVLSVLCFEGMQRRIGRRLDFVPPSRGPKGRFPAMHPQAL